MIKANWQIFASKFSDNPREKFEWLCYLLFCSEFNKPNGIIGYINQAAIEHEPIEVENDIIGFQAKYYSVPLTDKKNEFIETLEKVNKYYPKLTKLLIYTNQKWGKNKNQNEPKAKIDVEKKANALNIKIEWRDDNYFKSPNAILNHDAIFSYFFTNNLFVIETIKRLKYHTENILSQIHNDIDFAEKKICINRLDDINKIQESNNQVIIISGQGGVGKTAIIKQLCNTDKNKPYFLLKATEFDIKTLDDIFKESSIQCFLNILRNDQDKIFIIDSAEKLLDIKNSDPIKELFTVLIKEDWKIIFTTRDSYLDDLNYLFLEVYKLVPLHIRVNPLTEQELIFISSNYLFKLPSDKKIMTLIQIPFYLSEYVKYYSEDIQELDYAKFKNALWNKTIKKGNIEREQCFLRIAHNCSRTGIFFTIVNDLGIEIELVKDGILGKEGANYFIAHDIHEEWALEKIIESSFITKCSNKSFFKIIGHSLQIRRSFRSWLSDKLFENNNESIKLIEYSILSDEIENFWKDEIIVSVLLSNYSATFFNAFSQKLIENNMALLKRIAFILQIACKEVDYSLFHDLGNSESDFLKMEYIFTIPKGNGWKNFIKFIYNNLSSISFNDIEFVMPIIYDWTIKNNKEETTRYAALIALGYYQFSIENDKYLTHIGRGKEIIGTIINGVFEIQQELNIIFNSILKNKWKYHDTPYNGLIEEILKNPPEALLLLSIFPKHILNICDLFWTYIPKKHSDDEIAASPFLAFNRRSEIDIDQYFNLEKYLHNDCFPPSAFQTPIYWLLIINYQDTIEFILAFVNQAVEFYAESKFDSSVIKTKVIIDDLKVEQWTNYCLWCMYRGTSSPISPYLLQSIHMALEKYLLDTAKKEESEKLEKRLKYLLKKTKSASITSVVTSIVLAHPEKCFNIAKILFQTKDFFGFDMKRQLSEHEARTLYALGAGINYKNDAFYKERQKTCDDIHRQEHLETLLFKYQIVNYFKTIEEFSSFRTEIGLILDNYYMEVENSDTNTDEIRHWRLCLARMDTRKMKPEVIKNESQTYIQFVPELDPDLKKYSEDHTKKYTDSIEYLSLNLWSRFAYENNDKKTEYKQYENSPQVVMRDLRKVLDLPKTDYYQGYYHSTPIYVSTVLIRDYFNDISDDDKNLCKEIIIEYAALLLNVNYFYQIGDGVEQAIISLPDIAKFYPDKAGDVKIILIFALFESFTIGNTMKFFFDFAIEAIHKLYKINPIDAQAILYAYIILYPKYNETIDTVQKEAYVKDRFASIGKKDVIGRFLSENENIFNALIDNSITLNISKINSKSKIIYLLVIFKIVANIPNHNDFKKIIMIILPIFATYFSSDDIEDKRFNYKERYSFYETFAELILKMRIKDILVYLKPFNDNIPSQDCEMFFNQFVYAEEKIKSYDNFWYVWNYFRDSIIYVSNGNNHYRYRDEIIESYLFARVFWNQNAKTWHSFKQNNHFFFYEIIQKIGHHPSTLYSIIKLICGVGSVFFDYGIDWVSYILEKNLFSDKKLSKNTLYYIESYMRQYIYKNREKIRHDNELKQKSIIILNFIIEKGSVIGYLLRERIL